MHHQSKIPNKFNIWIAKDSSAGLLLAIATATALLWANSAWHESYTVFSELKFGISILNLELPIHSWITDGLLTFFFFLVGMEVKKEFVSGELRTPKKAMVPILAAFGGVIVPAIIYLTITSFSADSMDIHGWAIPTATDVAFALAVLAIFGKGLPKALRSFLLTLAVMDDLIIILVIAIFYSQEIQVIPLFLGLVSILIFAVLVKFEKIHGLALLPIGIISWWFFHESGVHPTVAGALLGFCVPILRGNRLQKFSTNLTPVTYAIILPLFAFFSAGISFVGEGASWQDFLKPVFFAVIFGMILGKLLGVLGTTLLVTKLTSLRLPDSIGLRDLLPIGFLAGIGFTVSILVTELSFSGSDQYNSAKTAIILASTLSATLGAVTLRWNARLPRSKDMNEDGIEDSNNSLIDG
ncbi:MAG: Na+/H+ antiporter NhaA [Microbacteriaceae bacterium]|nr:Na+/H+ antiporter NhaA [Microbacteriaceae bacterium]